MRVGLANAGRLFKTQLIVTALELLGVLARVLLLALPGTAAGLVFVERLRDAEGGVDGIAGAAALALGGDDAQLYVAGPGDDAVATFGRDATTGQLAFLGLQRDGTAGV